MKTICLVLFASCMFGCGSHDDHPATDAARPSPICTAIMDLCHPYAANPGPAMQCHDWALMNINNGDVVCRMRQAECTAACQGQSDSGARDVTTDAVADAVTTDAVTDSVTMHDGMMHDGMPADHGGGH